MMQCTLYLIYFLKIIIYNSVECVFMSDANIIFILKCTVLLKSILSTYKLLNSDMTNTCREPTHYGNTSTAYTRCSRCQSSILET